MSQNLISICVPSFNKPLYIKRLLNSLSNQTHKNIEIIISDDTSDDSVKIAISTYLDKLNIKYYKNTPPLKSPANWNAALEKAKGDFYMLIHQDDWLHSPTALENYINIFEQHPEVDFAFCKNTGVNEDGKETILQDIPSILSVMKKKPNHLLRFNVIGPPSNTMLRNRVDIRYDERLIWLVDVDYYVRILKAGYLPFYIPQHLVSIGLHNDQTTVYVNNNTDILVKENILFAEKIGIRSFDDIFIYDYYWRFLRNYTIRDKEDILRTGIDQDLVLPVFEHMISAQRKFSKRLLKNGFLSKSLMLISYCTR